MVDSAFLQPIKGIVETDSYELFLGQTHKLSLSQ